MNRSKRVRVTRCEKAKPEDDRLDVKRERDPRTGLILIDLT